MSSSLISTNNGSPASGDRQPSQEPTSIHSALIDEIYDIPMKEVTRPLPSILDEEKVQSLMETIQVRQLSQFPSIAMKIDDCRQWTPIESRPSTFSGMKHRARQTITSLQWVAATVGSESFDEEKCSY
jgi:hypothetical protein